MNYSNMMVATSNFLGKSEEMIKRLKKKNYSTKKKTRETKNKSRALQKPNKITKP